MLAVNRRIIDSGISGWIETDRRCWIATLDKNAFIEIDKIGGRNRILGSYSGKRYNSNGLTGGMIQVGSKILLSPLGAETIAIYDAERETLEWIPLDNLKQEGAIPYDEKLKFGEVVGMNGKYVYLLGYTYPAIIKVNMNTLESVYLTDWLSMIPDIEKNYNRSFYSYFCEGYVADGELVYLPAGFGSGVWKMNTLTDELEYIAVQSEFKGFLSISSYGKWCILTGVQGDEEEILLWDRTENSINPIRLSDVSLWHKPIIYKEDIYLFPWQPGGHILCIDGKTLHCKRFSRLDMLLVRENALSSSVFSVKPRESEITFVRTIDRCWITYNFEQDTITEHYYEIQDEEFLAQCEKENYDDLYADVRSKNEMFRENIMPLQEFIKRV